jgi:protein-S-isoprenylcysteine O-methyltransferase Ste14
VGSTQATAPWYFRQRFTMIGALYGASFFLGYLLTGIFRLNPEPAFTATGRAWPLGLVAIACVVAGWTLRVWASSHLSGAIVWQDDVHVGGLRVAGPYRFTRNPLYLGNVLQAVGIGLLGPWLVLALIASSQLVFAYALIFAEERALAKAPGDAYARYRARVARFLPLPWKNAPPSRERGSWRQGVQSERMTGTFTAAIIGYIVFVSLR